MTDLRSQWFYSLVPLLISAFFFYGFNNAMTSIMPEYFLHLGGSDLIAGVQNSCFLLLAIILRLGFGPLADKYGPKRLLFLGALGFTLPTIFLPFCPNLVLAIILRALQAIGLAAFMPNIAFYVRESLPTTRIPTGIGFARFASVLSLMVVPLGIFAVRDQWGNNAMFAAFVGLGLAGMALALILPKTPAATTKSSNGSAGPSVANQLKSLFAGVKEHKALMALPFVLGLGYGVLLAFGPLFTTSNFPTINGGLVLTAASIGGLGGSLLASKAAKLFTQKRAISASILVNALGLVLMACTSSWLVPFFAGAFLAGFGYFVATTLFVASIGTLQTTSGAGSLLATQQSCLDLGVMAGNLCAGILLNLSASLNVVFILIAVLLLVGFVSSIVSQGNNR